MAWGGPDGSEDFVDDVFPQQFLRQRYALDEGGLRKTSP